mgnify:FL=1
MRITAILLLIVLCALPLEAKVYHSSDFGWEADQDVTEEFPALFEAEKLGKGDELVLEHTYRISGTHQLPDNFTLSAVKGAGFDVTDAMERRGAFLELGSGNTLRNLTITYLDTPPLGPTGQEHWVDFASNRGISAVGKTDLVIENCRLTGSIAQQVRLKDCSRVKFIGCHIAGGYWTIPMGGVSDVTFKRCLIEKCQGDGIKTGGSGKACRNILVEDCVFQDCRRDGIDTTGGFNHSIVRNCTFRRLGVSGIDLKAHYKAREGEEIDFEPENNNILIEECIFHDMPNGIVLSTGPDHPVVVADIMKYAVRDVDINDCLFGHAETPLRPYNDGGYGANYPTDEGEHMRGIFVKDAHSIRYRNMRLSGDSIMPVYVRSIAEVEGYRSKIGKEAVDALRSLHKEPTDVITGNVIDEPAPPIEPGKTDVPFTCGPQTLVPYSCER